MSLAEELLADLEEDDEIEEEEEEYVDIDEQLQAVADDKSVNSLTKLNQSKVVSTYMYMYTWYQSGW